MLETPRPMPYRARWGGEEVTRQAVFPSCGWCVHARAGGRTPDRQGAPVVAGLRTVRGEVGHWTGSVPQSSKATAGEELPGSVNAPSMPFCATWRGLVFIEQAVSPGCGQSVQLLPASQPHLQGGEPCLARSG